MKKIKLFTIIIAVLLLGYWSIYNTNLGKESYSRLHNNIGYFYLKDERIEKAIMEFHKALRNKNYSHIEFVYFNLAKAYIEKEDFPKALEALGLALKYKPNFKEAQAKIDWIKSIDK